ncbi:hypothetical protein MLD38_032259 [Melastoma candidum]|uniref:Uncharacterized protein n=1 Tax=Melastoma candidum TaxID=119954 RepID=A0ACB9M3Q2_9MYRT|nr:hypothetical protein MLD38_032259 [Melastoma candidum]
MISSKKILQLATKWRMAAAMERKRASFRRSGSRRCLSNLSTRAVVAQKGHFAVYTMDGRRFEVPLSYLGNGAIRELFTVAEEEFGIPSAGPIVLPIKALSMEYIISLIRQGFASELEKALSESMNRCSCYLSAEEAQACAQLLCT